MSRSLLVFALLLSSPTAAAEKRRPMTIDDLLLMKRVGGPSLSPDGARVAYTLTVTDPDSLARTSHVFSVPADGSAPPHQLTHGDKGDRSPRWSPDGTHLAFVSSRSGTPQIHLLPAAGGEARKLTSLSTGASEPIVWSPDGTRIAFVSDVDPSCKDDACNKKKAEAKEKGPKVHHARALYHRHWNEWRIGVRHHVFVVEVATGKTVDVTPGDFDAPPHHAEDGGFAFSPEGKEIAFVSNREGADREAWTTNADLWAVPVGGGTARRLTTNPAADVEPNFTPDGKSIVFRSQERPGFESDRFRVKVLDRMTGKVRVVFETPDLSADGISLSRDGKTVYFEADAEGRHDLYAVPLAGGEVRLVKKGGQVSGLSLGPDGSWGVVSMSTATSPTDLWRISTADGSQKRLTDHNRAWLDKVEVPAPRSFTVKGGGGAPVQSWLYPPPGFSPAKKYPVVFLIHGGPQGAWGDGWHYRWNPTLWAAQGWVVVCPNPRGSTGFGQKFTDEISRDWSGKVMEDLGAVFDATLANPFVDGKRQAIAGASYGGYAVDWLISQSDRFKAAVSHDGVFNLESASTSTEELWFPEWEHGGLPWSQEARAFFRKASPHYFVDRIKTPTLIITNDLDYRVTVDQGFQLFTALRRRGVPAELLDFPEEGHWVLKPKNNKYWHETVFGWIKRWL